ncbi:MAG: 50S ribosomal protein L9 [Lachnospiraceae bacterium]|nr:50S ribosomal protein L9 [Lachnospiraceae bacterium]
MKVILLADVKNVGKKGDVAEVSDAYARNVLLRKKLGVEVSGKTMNDLKLQKANEEKVAAENLAAAQELAKKLENAKVTLQVKVGEGGKLFGSISSREIADAAKTQLGLDIDKKKIQLSAPIKTIGTTTVPIKLHTKVNASLDVLVEALS